MLIVGNHQLLAKTEATLPISHEAFELCGEVGTGKVFKGLSRSMINYPLKNWLKKAKIQKHITFHHVQAQYFFFFTENKRFTEF